MICVSAWFPGRRLQKPRASIQVACSWAFQDRLLAWQARVQFWVCALGAGAVLSGALEKRTSAGGLPFGRRVCSAERVRLALGGLAFRLPGG